ncbi:MAG TPA: hypothetical protein VFQ25_02530 [Ktedonobacterales bacterium]|nr:hypothetical protein [Ktedonobacterales bacterium]
MSEMGDWDDVSARGEPTAGAAPAPRVATDGSVMFLPAPRPTTPLAETAIYRPGALIATGFLAPPAAGALALAALAWGMGAAPLWLPLALLLWVPVMLAGWSALRGVRLTREAIAFGRPLGAWRVIPLDQIERLERIGPRLRLVTAEGRRVSFTPALLARGAQLRRRLLLSLPLQTLSSSVREEARRLVDGDAPQEALAVGALTVRPARWLVGLAAGLALAGALAAGAMAAWAPAMPWIALAPGALALAALVACIWLAQDVFIGDRGVIVHFSLIRATGAVAWDELITIERMPGEIALVLRGPHALICAGPGLLGARDARRMREILGRYALERGTPVAPRNRL